MIMQHGMKVCRVMTVGESFGLIGGQGRLCREAGMEYVAVASPGRALEQWAEAERVRAVGVPMERAIAPVKDLKALWQLYRLWRHERPDIVHANTPKGSLLAMVAAWAARVPNRVYTVTGLRFETAQGRFRKLLIAMERIACACATRVVPEGQGVKATLEREHITSKPLQVLANGNINGIDTAHFAPQRRWEPGANPNGELRFVFVGRMVHDKGIEELTRAFSRLHREFPHVRLTLIGGFEPELDPISPQAADTIRTHEAITATGFQSDIRPWLNEADVLVHPSFREGFPNVVLQAGAMGLPAVVTDINGSNEIIIHGENGLIVPPQQEEPLYQAMRRLAANPGEAARLASEARERVARLWGRELVQGATVGMYRGMEKGGGR